MLHILPVATLYRVATSREDTVMRPPRCVLKGLIERQPENWLRFVDERGGRLLVAAAALPF